MTATCTFTANEARAVKALYSYCLGQMGGKTYADLESDPFTWVDTSVLVEAGWTKAEANGTFGALIEKRAVAQVDKNEWALELPAAKWASEN